MSLRRNDSSTAFFSHWCTVQPVAVLLGHAQLAPVEQVERGLDRIADLAPGGEADPLAVRERGLDRPAADCRAA